MELTRQQVFDQVCVHLYSQGKGSRSSYGKARMRTGRLRDPLGYLATDQEYQAIPEGEFADALSSFPKRLKQHRGIIVDLQEAHDFTSNEKWEFELALHLRKVATKHGVRWQGKEAYTSVKLYPTKSDCPVHG